MAPSSGAMAEQVMAQCGTQVSLSEDSIEDGWRLDGRSIKVHDMETMSKVGSACPHSSWEGRSR